MHALRLAGVTEDGTHLILTGGDSDYVLPIDAALRSALRRDTGRQVLPGHVAGTPMSPVEVQALIRGGADAEEAAERAGWSVEKVHRYEGPILAEREHVARMATAVRLRPRGPASGSPTLLDRVTRRLADRGVSIDDVDWDSWRDTDGRWVLELDFTEGEHRRRASWTFVKSSMSISPLDREAGRLSDDDPDLLDPGPDHDPGPEAYDTYETYEPVAHRLPERPHVDEGSDLMATLRSTSRARNRRRGSRRATSSPATVTHADPMLIEASGDETRGAADAPAPESEIVETAREDALDAQDSGAEVPDPGLDEALAAPAGHQVDDANGEHFPADPESPRTARNAPATTSLPSVEESDGSASEVAAIEDVSEVASDTDGPAFTEEGVGEEGRARSLTDAEPAQRRDPGLDEALAHSTREARSVESSFPADPEAPAAPTHEEPHLPFDEDDAAATTPTPAPSTAAAESPMTQKAQNLATENPQAAAPTRLADDTDSPAPSSTSTSAATSPANKRTRRRTKKTAARPAAQQPATAPEQETSASASQADKAAMPAQPRPADASTAPRPTPRAAAQQRAPQSRASKPRTAPAPSTPSEAADTEAAPKPAPPRRQPSSSRRRGRASVPAWDDIMFGAKPGEE